MRREAVPSEREGAEGDQVNHCVVVLVRQDHHSPSGQRVTATWLSQHNTNGTMSGADDPITALRRLADRLEEADERRAVINSIDAEEDP